jgi:8-oxo-dGTP pyrophosphatase MutT (NUDIX family)
MSFVTRLKTALQEINQEDCPQVPNPPGCKKRASVAVVLRVRPVFPQKPTYDQDILSSPAHTVQESLESFFSQSWVQQGDPEVLLIKRAARPGDRWTGHIALPGGKREPRDPDDRATSERETREETGLELNVDHCLYIGNLPERILTTTWNNVP